MPPEIIQELPPECIQCKISPTKTPKEKLACNIIGLVPDNLTTNLPCHLRKVLRLKVKVLGNRQRGINKNPISNQAARSGHYLKPVKDD